VLAWAQASATPSAVLDRAYFFPASQRVSCRSVRRQPRLREAPRPAANFARPGRLLGVRQARVAPRGLPGTLATAGVYPQTRQGVCLYRPEPAMAPLAGAPRRVGGNRGGQLNAATREGRLRPSHQRRLLRLGLFAPSALPGFGSRPRIGVFGSRRAPRVTPAPTLDAQTSRGLIGR